DYDVVGTALAGDLIETRWTRKKTIGSYTVSRNKIAEDTEGVFVHTVVTCADEDETDNFHCFGYFVGVIPEKAYDLSVEEKPKTQKPTITLKGTTTPTFLKEVTGMSMKISSVNTKWHKGLRSFEVSTCVHQAETSTPSTFEAILINKRGQWEKVKGVTHQIGDELCFDALHVNMYNFDLSEDLTLVVVKRGSDGLTVLESANTNISVGANLMTAALGNSSVDTM
ncbi:unnamed protein product, partial [Meganyctiphanes norvegica]